ncbi:nitrate/nitrite sensor protein NarX [mine drainage metagenome]|uniref:histidine kinase n=1 Tax=mine drainage metagenome TaxID=410659 RepID=A0A1J5RYP9_9ZZZZ
MNDENQTPPQSVLGRLGIAMGTIVIFAMASIMVSTIFTEMSAGKARAINVAGSLRMQSYLLASQLNQPGLTDDARRQLVMGSVREYEARLNDPTLLAGVQTELKPPITEAYRDIQQRWETHFKPLALAAVTDPAKRAQFVATVGGFVSRIDHMVKLLEQELEDKIQWLRLVQGVSLFVIVIVVLLTMYLMHTQVIIPLNDLLACARAVRKGNFQVRARHTQPDELGQLGAAFNTMVQDLSQMYANLEVRVEEKTEELARSNRSLELLYGTIRTLSERRVTRDALMHVLREVERVMDVTAGAICAYDPELRQGLLLAADPGDVGGRQPICPGSCEQCLGDGGLSIRETEAADGAHTVSVPLTDGGRNYGVMPLQLPPGRELAPWQLQLLEAVGRHIGAALAMSQRNEERHRLALFEERSVIARELHDSLAQSLTYLKIQVTRLQALLGKSAPAAQTGEVVGELKSGLNNAYRQLRELLTTFRLRIDGHGLNAALEETVREFTRHGNFAIRLDNRLLGIELASNEEIHVLQVIREALANVLHHARAASAEVSLERLENNRVRVRVDDDGAGIAEGQSPLHHFGLKIMHDRAHSLHGELTVERRETGGTRVELAFDPATPFGNIPALDEGSGA